VNPFAMPMIDSLNLDWAFIGCNGIHAKLGVTNVNLPEAEIKTRVLARSRRRVLIADATKLGRADLAVIAPIAEFETLVTAGDAEPGILDALAVSGLAIIRG
jgi:DeoR family transcriptional regulator of aga operon